MTSDTATRRRDLIIGSLASLLVLGMAVVLSGPSSIQATPIKDAVVPVKPTPPIVVDDPIPVDLADSSSQSTASQPVPPHQPDAPQPDRPDDFIQPMEPAREPTRDVRTIPMDWSRVGPASEAFDPSKLDQLPVAKYQTPPQYPYEMRQRGVTGQVVVDFIVDARGNVRNASVVRSTNSAFESAAVAAVGKWKFSPGRKDGRAVMTHMVVPIEFTLDGAR